MKVAQITDLHILASDEDTLFGVKPNYNFYKIVNSLKIHNYDFILLTGDISQDDTPRSYKIVEEQLSSLSVPIYYVAGNHDNIEIMDRVFGRNHLFNNKKHVTTPNWDFLFVNSKQEGEVYGHISDEEYNILRFNLNKIDPKTNIALIMHHHPVKSGTPLLDKYILQNPESLLDIIRSNNSIKLVCCGHVHGDYTLKAHNCSVEISPATCFQFAKGAEKITIEPTIGYKTYLFDHTGYTCETVFMDTADENINKL